MFFQKWENQIRDISFILNFLHTYPQVLKQFEFQDLITSDDLINSQSDWVRYCSKYYGLEKEFFMPYWVPIQKSSFDYFIDLSDKKYPIFKFSFFDSIYKRIDLFSSVNELLLACGSDVDFKSIAEGYRDEWQKYYNEVIERLEREEGI